MSSILKIQSARANGARSRGPVTPEGRARSSKNAIKHGLSSSAIVLSNESESDFEKLLESYLAQFNPQSEIETSLVEQLVAARWRMERVWAIETSLLDLEMVEQEDAVDQKYESIDEIARTALAFRALCDNSRALNLLSRYESQFRRAGERILDSLLRLRKQQLENKELQNEPNHLPTRVSGEEPQLESEKPQNEPNHPITRVPEDDPQPPPGFAPSNPIAPDLGDFTATINLLPQASMNTPSPTSVVSVAPRSCCRAAVPRNTGFVRRTLKESSFAASSRPSLHPSHDARQETNLIQMAASGLAAALFSKGTGDRLEISQEQRNLRAVSGLRVLRLPGDLCTQRGSRGTCKIRPGYG